MAQRPVHGALPADQTLVRAYPGRAVAIVGERGLAWYQHAVSDGKAVRALCRGAVKQTVACRRAVVAAACKAFAVYTSEGTDVQAQARSVARV
ncbi:hypothetical protein D3C81_2053550 [compost metagenome]